MKTDPLYLKLYRELRDKIEKGSLTPGQRLPSVRQMAQEHGLGKITVLRAYDDLKADGWIDSSERAGYFVRSHSAALDVPQNPLRRPAVTMEVVQLDFQSAVIEANRNPKLIPFGGSTIAPSLLPYADFKSSFAKIMRRSVDRAMGYEPLGGMPELKREIVRRSLLWGGTFSDEELIITSGATEALALAIQATTRPGDTVAVESPTYFGFFTMLSLLGRKVIEVPTDARTGVDVSLLEQLIQKKTVAAAILIPNFQNPTGSLIPDDTKKIIAHLAQQNKFPIIECDTSSDLHFEGMRPKPIQCFSKSGYVLSVQSFSKLVAPGLRLAYIVPGRFHAEVQATKRGLSLASSSSAQLAMAAFLKDGGYDRHLRRLRSRLRLSLPRLKQSICDSFPKDTCVSRPAGGYLLWVQLPEGVRGRSLWSKGLEKGISTTPGELFSLTDKYRNYIRLNCGVPIHDKTLTAVRTLGQLAGLELQTPAKEIDNLVRIKKARL